MRECDFDEFCGLIDASYDLIGVGANKSISAGAKGLFFNALRNYPLDVVRSALSAHCLDRTRGRFTPKPADIIEQIESASLNDGRLGAEEAWAIALTSRDDSETVVWTQEIAEALRICSPVLESGDEVAARMTFKEAYNRITAQARTDHVPAVWSASVGWDRGKREAALTRAHTSGFLPAPEVTLHLPSFNLTDDEALPCPEGLTKVKQFMATLAAHRIDDADREEQRKQDEREAVRVRKDEINVQVNRRNESICRTCQ